MAREIAQIINAGLDREALKKELATSGFVEIQDFLEESVANQIFNCLEDDISWELVFREGDQDVKQTFEQLRDLSPENRQQLHANVIEQAKVAYQFSYFRYPMIDAYLNNWTPRLLLNDVLDSINSQESLNFFRYITGEPRVKKVEVQATLYAPGHFLKLHNDMAKTGDERLYACVIGLTRGWQSHWGGILQFVEDGKVTRSCTPGFNTCVIFKVPQDHQVSYIAPFATQRRYSLTGWLRAD